MNVEISSPQNIRIEDYNYNLPDDRIAKYPLTERDNSKLLVFSNGEISDSVFKNISDFIPASSLLVFNNTKVIQARLHFRKDTGALIEIFCLEPHEPHDYILNFQQNRSCSWLCMVGNLKKWKEGALVRQIEKDGIVFTLKAIREQGAGESLVIRFEWDNNELSFSEVLDAVGELPIPPYLNRDTEEQDKQTYQTVYSKIEGSVAAPTAGLHFTDKVFSALEAKGIETAEITLHVGAGTFKPVKTEKVGEHEMHAEFISVNKSVIEHLLKHAGRIIAVGTTSVRTLESLYYIGEMIENEGCSNDSIEVGQWQPYADESNRISPQKALENILNYLNKSQINTILASTRIIIAPGYTFKIVGGVVTNFHQPKSTLLLLVSAFTKDNKWLHIYRHAMDNGYRFLSYGDSSLLLGDSFH